MGETIMGSPTGIGEEMTDMEVAMDLIGHIDNPYIIDAQGHSARSVYIEEAKRISETLTNPEARKMIEEAIAKHSQKMEEVG